MGALHPILTVVAAGALVCVFARAALHKAMDLAMFAHTMGGYRLLPAAVLFPIAVGLLVLEIAIAIGLVVPASRAVAAGAAFILFAVYAGAIAINLVRGNTLIDCGCGGAGQGLSWYLVLRNFVLAGLCLVALAPPLPVEMNAAAWTTAAAGIVSFLVLFAGVEKLIDNWSWLEASNRAHEPHNREGHG